MAKESIKDLTEQELKDKLKDYSDEMRNLKVQSIMGQIENKKRKWFVRKKIAQIKTILHEYKLAIRKSSKPESDKK
ncbi:MAG: 50S ribosomal protein L29 [Spirochaetes bacterium]|nr:50S ribosomal protein L29 [Spirochaetota bacterium]